MTISSGSKIGSYEILSPLGAGGMGEVWRAHDSRINRDVAIKVLPEEVTANADRLARFEQEAQAAGALNHPNILTVFEMGTHEGHPYLVTELLEGSSLREKLGDTRRESGIGEHLSIRKALELGAQIATGLAAAHEKGIVHRDLKPENIFVTSDGRVKILDFGLAKLTTSADEENLTNAQTAQRKTSPGTVLGTAGYMAPEQVRGQVADQRSDIFACGVVLYEMLSGKRAFDGRSSADTASAILREDPAELSGEHLRIPLAVERIVRRCLEKEPSQRFQSARDLAFALEAVEGSSTSSGNIASIEGPHEKRGRRLPIALLLIAIVAAAAAYYAGLRHAPPPPDVSTVPVTESAKFTSLTFRPLIVFEAAFSPDQRTVIFSASEDGSTPSIYTVSPDYPEPRDAGLPNVHLLAVSSKGEMAVLTKPHFMSHRQFEGTLARLPVGGAAPREILEGVRQAAFSPDGSELAIIRTVEGVDRLEYPIGKVLHTAAGYLSDLKISPDNKHIAFFEHPQKWDDRGPIRVVDLEGKVTTLADGYWGAEGIAWARDGKSIIYSANRAGAIYNINAVDLAGNERLVRSDSEGLVIHDIAADGRWLVSKYQISFEVWGRVAGMTKERDLSWLDASGNGHLSLDGTMLLFDEESAYAGSNYATCLRRLPDSPVVRLGEGLPQDLSLDGKWALVLVYSTPQRLVAYPTGAGEARNVDPNGLESYSGARWLPDGKTILICGWTKGSRGRCYVRSLDGGPMKPVTPEGLHKNPLVSPDGTRVAVRDDAGRGLIFALEGGEPVEVKGLTLEDEWIRWSTDGKGILVAGGDQAPVDVESVDVATGKREKVLTIDPSDRTSLLSINDPSVAADGKSYAYGVWRTRTKLFTLEGLR
ncbi:MAG: protein kinase domain-containing protein [Thermoanaerobaculia bacterium]